MKIGVTDVFMLLAIILVGVVSGFGMTMHLFEWLSAGLR